MTVEQLEKLSSTEVQDYIIEHVSKDVQKLLLHNKEIFGLPFGLVADQIIARKKISSKVPTFYTTKGIVYPPSLNLEQSSSEATATFKLKILLKELKHHRFASIADISGGFGIDSYFLSQAASQLHFVEPNNTLAEIVKHNFKHLRIENVIFHSSTAENFLNFPSQKFDFIFVDPSRRDVLVKKVFRLADCQPDIKALLPKLFTVTKHILLKASPLLDLHQGLNELVHVKKVIVVSVGNECKELLFLVSDNFLGEPIIETYNLDKKGEMKQSFAFTFDQEKTTESNFGEPQTYLYEPNVSVLKSGAFKLVGEKFGLKKLHPNTHLYTSSKLKKDFPGRIFKIVELKLDAKSIHERKANVITRNYPLKAEELKLKLKLEDGGENYVIGFSGMKKKYIVLAIRLE